MEQVFFHITIVVFLAALLSFVFRFFKQPVILAYIFTGIILGSLGVFPDLNSDALHSLGQLGITLLLFILGLEVKLSELRTLGKSIIIISLLQVWFVFFLVFFTAIGLGYGALSGIYIGIALTFSSTIVIVKLLSDKKELQSLHGKISVGILLVQDFIALLAIIFLTNPMNASGVSVLGEVGLLCLKLILLVVGVLAIGQYIFPRILPSIAKSSESLFLFSLAWVFSLAAFVASKQVGFSIEIGGFLAGLALAHSSENYQIVAKMKTLRDFFVTIFFVLLGLQMHFTNLLGILGDALVFSTIVLFGKSFITTYLTSLLGYKKRTSFLVGVSLAQVSEFSLIILYLGQKQGAIPESVMTLVVVVSIVTFALSTGVIEQSKQIYFSFAQYLNFLEGKHTTKENWHLHLSEQELEDHVVLIGGHQMGQSVLHALEEQKEKVIVIDFDPEIVHKLQRKGVPIYFGDIVDAEIQERARLDHAKLVVSTVPDLDDNLMLIENLNKHNRKALIIVMAYEVSDAKELYKKGADYVVLPHLAGGLHLAKILKEENLEKIRQYKKEDSAYLNF